MRAIKDAYSPPRTKHKIHPSNLPPNQPLQEIETITISLQCPDLPCSPHLPPQLLDNQQPPLPLHPFNPTPNPPFTLQRHNLPAM